MKSPQQFKNPNLYVVKTDPSFLPEHWIVLWFDYKSNYFDSTGAYPFPEARSVHQKSGPWEWNSTRVQSVSSKKCGEFCLYFSYYKSQGVSMKDIVDSLSSRYLRLNDRKVAMFYEHYK